MIKIGITGGIGSGKTVVSEIFRLHGIPMYIADLEAKKLNDSSPRIRKQLTQYFGEELYAGDKLDRQKLASIIFHDKQKLSIVNSIIHPELAHHFTEWCLQRSEYAIVGIDAALLVEAGFYRFVDKVIVVSAPEGLRFERVIQRDQTSYEDVQARVQSQLPEEEKIRYADYIIYNDNRKSLIKQVSCVMETIMAD